jgi:glyoxylase I family protein
LVEVIGIDHIYIAVTDICLSEEFYDKVMIRHLGFRKNIFKIDGDHHIQYYNRQFGFVLRPAKIHSRHNAYSPGIHHFCFRVESADDVYKIAKKLQEDGIAAVEAQLYPEYSPDYVATYFEDPDGIKLEITNYRQERRERYDNWNKLE